MQQESNFKKTQKAKTGRSSRQHPDLLKQPQLQRSPHQKKKTKQPKKMKRKDVRKEEKINRYLRKGKRE